MAYNAQSSAQPRRRRDLDVIGILVVGGLSFLHTARIFAPVVFYIKNAPANWKEPSQLVAATFMAFFTLWGMPLMFAIAEMAVWYSLRKRTAGEFVREQVRRLLVPFVVGLAGNAFHKHPAHLEPVDPPSVHSKPPLAERIPRYAVEAQRPFYVLHSPLF